MLVQLLAKEGSQANLTELVAAKLVRPRAADDSRTTKLAKRLVGEAVDYWHEGGWWTVSVPPGSWASYIRDLCALLAKQLLRAVE